MDVSALDAIQEQSYASASAGVRAAWPEADALRGRELAAFLERHRYCVLATSRADGRAHAAPVAFVVHDGAFWFATAPGLRLRNVRANPWAAVTVMEGDADVGEAGVPHVALTAEGDVHLHPVERWTWFEDAWLRRHTDPPTWAAAVLELRPARIFSHAARA